MSRNRRKKTFVFGIIFLFIVGMFVPCSQSLRKQMQENPLKNNEHIDTLLKNGTITCYTFGTTSSDKQERILSTDEATLIFKTLDELISEITQNPYNNKTQSLKIALVELLDEKGLLPNSVSKETYLSLLNPKWVQQFHNMKKQSIFSQAFMSRGTTVLCSVGGQGRGLLVPLFLLPRPRITMLWFGDGTTLAANLLTSRGYAAGGVQTGFTLGFMGIGLSYALPGYSLYGFIGYALLATTSAEYVEYYPPNRAPEISDVQPLDGQQNVPLSLTELQFRIQDADGDLMSYSVTTEPDIGSASGNLKPFGVYKVPISGLMDLTSYTWHIQVTDGKDTTEKICQFTTEAIAPIISNPLPADGERDVPMDLPQLQFTLKDYQGDAMEYTVETSPNIGFKHETGVHNGTYTIPISGMTYGATYRWFVNATDGAHWTRKVFTFETGYPSQFNPFDYGWSYRKQITINHTHVLGTLQNFPVLISQSDADLSLKAQADGGDIMFMNDIGVSTRLYHDLESYDTSSGTLITWVKIPVLSSTTDTVFYMYYGNPDCIDQEYPEKTWDANYRGVWHLTESTGLRFDSTINDNDCTASGTTHTTSAKIDGGEIFNERTDSIYTNTNMIGFSTFTIECLFSFDNSVGGTDDKLFSIPINRPGVARYSDNRFQVWVDGHNQIITSTHTFADTDWHYVVLVANGYQLFLYVDSILEGSAPWAGSSGTSSFFLGDNSINTDTFFGTIDEARISDIARTSNWINTGYNNIYNQTEFIEVGPEVQGP